MTVKIYLPVVTDAGDDDVKFVHGPTKRGTFFRGREDEHLACGKCKAILAHGTSTRTFFNNFRNPKGRVVLFCDCGAQNAVNVDVSERYEGRSPQFAAYKVTALSRQQVRAGSWYFGFRCPACHERFEVFNDERDGSAELKFAGQAMIDVECSLCGVASKYQPQALENWQA